MTSKKETKEKAEKNSRNTDNNKNLRESSDKVSDNSEEMNRNGNPEDNSSEKEQEETASADSPKSDTVAPEEKSSEEKLAEIQDKYIRLSAEFDNYRKRTLREKIELSKNATESLIVGLLPLMDDFERGISHLESAADSNALKEGIDLIYSKFRMFFDRNGIKEIDALNRDFDVDLHDAVTKVPVSDKKMKGKVVDVIQKGYMLNDKIIRFSKVVVGE
jgi:molecular chaperone GrpE